MPLVYVPVFLPAPGCFDYSGLVIQFDIRYCDPSCIVFLSQNCYSYSGSLMVPYKFLKCLFYICEICHGYSNRDCIEYIETYCWMWFANILLKILASMFISNIGLKFSFFVISLSGFGFRMMLVS